MGKTILTHNSSFHSDDVFAVATLLLIYPDATVIRSRDKDKIILADIVVDTGMIYNPSTCRFDHHQDGGAGERLNGIPYAAFGLVWKEFGAQLCGNQEVSDLIDIKLVQPLDAHDNGDIVAKPLFEGVRDYTIGDFLYSFLDRPYRSEEEIYHIFMEVVEIAKSLLIREIAKAKETIEGEEKVKRVYADTEDKRLIVLEEELPWKKFFSKNPEVLYVVYPRIDGKWSVKAVQDVEYASRKPFPESWGGKLDQELQEITGVSDAIFCHRGLFMAAAKTKEGAIKLGELALNS